VGAGRNFCRESLENLPRRWYARLIEDDILVPFFSSTFRI
jgi:hypothetical protein